jgi:hypothetical protein
MPPRDSFEEFEATSLFCPRCKRATQARRRLLLVLPTGNKYDYLCSDCGTPVGGKTDNNAADFHALDRGLRRAPDLPRVGPTRPTRRPHPGLPPRA